MQVQDFARHYAGITDDELLRLALAPDELTNDARLALNAELSIRNLNKPEYLTRFHAQEEERKRDIAKQTGQFFLFYGTGRMRFGKAARRINPETGLYEFTTTVFIVFFWLPLLPTGTYRVLGKRQLFPNKIQVLEQLPLNWAQVCRVWAAAAGGMILLMLALKLL